MMEYNNKNEMESQGILPLAFNVLETSLLPIRRTQKPRNRKVAGANGAPDWSVESLKHSEIKRSSDF